MKAVRTARIERFWGLGGVVVWARSETGFEGRCIACVRPTATDGSGSRGDWAAALQYPHRASVLTLFEEDLNEGFGRVFLPGGLAGKYPQARREWAWQYVFPARRRTRDPRTGLERRHQLHEASLQRAVKEAARWAGSSQPARSRTGWPR